MRSIRPILLSIVGLLAAALSSNCVRAEVLLHGPAATAAHRFLRIALSPGSRSVKTLCGVARVNQQRLRITLWCKPYYKSSPMLDSEEKPLPAVGVFWIEEADYGALLKIFDDGDTMPRAWPAWRKMAEEMEKGLKAYGHPVMRVCIDPATFPAWCAAHGTTPGRQGRKMFVAAAVAERYGDQT
jgi:hypothetical protein